MRRVCSTTHTWCFHRYTTISSWQPITDDKCVFHSLTPSLYVCILVSCLHSGLDFVLSGFRWNVCLGSVNTHTCTERITAARRQRSTTAWPSYAGRKITGRRAWRQPGREDGNNSVSFTQHPAGASAGTYQGGNYEIRWSVHRKAFECLRTMQKS